MPDDHAKGDGAPKPFNPPPRLIPPRDTDERGRLLPLTEERRRQLLGDEIRLQDVPARITDEIDDDNEPWDEFLRNLGVDPATGWGLAP